MSMGASAPIRRSFDRALFAILCLGLLLVLILVALLPWQGPYWAVLLLFPINVLVYLGAGLLAWHYRPSNRMGALILLTGVWVFLGGAANTDVPALVWLGTIASSMPLAGFVHLLLAFPKGRVRGTIARATVALAYATSIVLEAPRYLFIPDPTAPGLAIVDAPELARWGNIAQELVGFLVLMSTLLVLVRRLRRASTAERRVLVPLYGYGIAAVVVLLFASRLLRPTSPRCNCSCSVASRSRSRSGSSAAGLRAPASSKSWAFGSARRATRSLRLVPPLPARSAIRPWKCGSGCRGATDTSTWMAHR